MLSRSFLVLWAAMLVAMAGIGMVSPLLPVYVRDELGGPEIAVALSFSGLAISQIIAAPFVGRLGDRFGVKPFIVGGFMLYALGAVGYWLTDSWELVVAFRVLSGFGAGAIFPLTLAYIGRLAPEGREGSYIGVFAVAEVTGFGLGPLVGGAIRDAIDADAAFVTMAIMLAGTGLMTLLLLPQERREVAAGDTSPRDLTSDGSPALPWGQLLRRLDVRAGVVASIVISLGWGTAGTYMAVFVISDDGLGTDSALFVGLLLGLRSLLGAVFQPIAGFAADRMSRIWLVVAGLSVAAVAQFVIPDLPRDLVDTSLFGGTMRLAPWLLVTIVIVGIGEAFAFPAQQAIFVSIGRRVGMGSMMGLNQMGGGFGFLLGSLVGAWVVSGIGIDAVFRAAGVITIVGAVLFAVMMSRALGREAAASSGRTGPGLGDGSGEERERSA
jgi:DHA1 family multidrug resistance protein-like MFS transporter